MPDTGERTLTMNTRLKVSTLPTQIKSFLKGLGYTRREVTVVTAAEFNAPLVAEGRRGLTAALNLTTGETKVEKGAWGGPSPWDRSRIDALACADVKIKTHPDGVFFDGEDGSYGVCGRLVIHPEFKTLYFPLERTA